MPSGFFWSRTMDTTTTLKEILDAASADDAVGESPRNPCPFRRDVTSTNRASAAQGSGDGSANHSQPAIRQEDDPVNHPSHYTMHPSGVECIDVTEWMTFNLGNCVKYIWRADHKGTTVQDLEKARWYLDREIRRIKALQ